MLGGEDSYSSCSHCWLGSGGADSFHILVLTPHPLAVVSITTRIQTIRFCVPCHPNVSPTLLSGVLRYPSSPHTHIVSRAHLVLPLVPFFHHIVVLQRLTLHQIPVVKVIATIICFVLLLTYFSSIGVVAVVSKICGSCDGSYQSYQSMNNISIRFVISEPQTTTTQRIICQEASSTQAGLLFHTAVILFTRH